MLQHQLTLCFDGWQATVAELKGVFHQLKSREQMLDMLQQNKPPTADGVAASGKVIAAAELCHGAGVLNPPHTAEAALKEAKATNQELQKRCETAVGTMQAQAGDIGAGTYSGCCDKMLHDQLLTSLGATTATP